MKNVMVDLETLGTVPGCAILSIGAVFFGPTGLGEEFHVIVDRASCKAAGLTEDDATIAWWGRQTGEAQKTLRDATDGTGAEALPNALMLFNGFLRHYGGGAHVWGNGADFDNPILVCACRAAHVSQGWGPWNGRCYRTLKGLVPGVPLQRKGTHHHALDDAKTQAEHAIALMRAAPLLKWPGG